MRTFTIRLRASKSLTIILLLIYLLAIFSVSYASDLNWWMRILTIITLTILASYHLYRFSLLRHPWSVVAINYDDEQWFLKNKKGGTYQAELVGENFATQNIALLRFRLQKIKKIIVVPIFKDAIQGDNEFSTLDLKIILKTTY